MLAFAAFFLRKDLKGRDELLQQLAKEMGPTPTTPTPEPESETW